MTTERVTFAGEYFAKILKDYANWKFAFCREAGQNSLDAGATEITVSIELVDGDTVVTWADNGSGMTADTLRRKFMAVGGSLKPDGAAGGFGVAKLILAFAHKRYAIRTSNILVTGQHDTFNVTDCAEVVKGLTLTTTIDGDHVCELTEACESWVTYTTTGRPVRFVLNGSTRRFMGALDAPVNVQDWCAIHVCDDSKLENGVKVRINGQYMFSTWTSVNKAILVELTGSSLTYLTSNRDGLQYDYANKLSKLVEQMLRDPEALFDTESDVIEFFEGDMGPAHNETDTTTRAVAKLVTGKALDKRENFSVELTEAPPADTDGGYEPVGYGSDRFNVAKEADTVRENRKVLTGRNDVVIMNKTNKPIPEKYTVEGMRPMEWRLLARWTRIVQACAAILGVRRTIRTGWIFSVTARAAYKRNTRVGSLVLLNPCVLDGNGWRKGFDTSRDSFYELVSLAVHELTHVTHSYHDEAYAGALTDNMAKVFANLATVNKAK